MNPLFCPSGQTSSLGAQAMTPSTGVTGCSNVAFGLYQTSPSVFGTVEDGYEPKLTGEYFAIPTRNGNVCPVGYYCAAGVKT